MFQSILAEQQFRVNSRKASNSIINSQEMIWSEMNLLLCKHKTGAHFVLFYFCRLNLDKPTSRYVISRKFVTISIPLLKNEALAMMNENRLKIFNYYLRFVLPFVTMGTFPFLSTALNIFRIINFHLPTLFSFKREGKVLIEKLRKLKQLRHLRLYVTNKLAQHENFTHNLLN